jgi:hypothetical protein
METYVSLKLFFNAFSEELFKVETLKGSRKEFQTLCPGRIIDTEVISLTKSEVKNFSYSDSHWFV